MRMRFVDYLVLAVTNYLEDIFADDRLDDVVHSLEEGHLLS